MAKIGEGDARWIVQDRADGQNVNNWHWVEKDIMPWVKKIAPEIFNNIPLIETSEASFKTTTTDMMDGECTVNNRKGKTIYIYDFEIKIKWKGELKDEEGNVKSKAKGTYHFPSVGMENDDDEHELEVICQEGEFKMKQMARDARPKVMAALKTLLERIRDGHKSLQQENKKSSDKTVVGSSGTKPFPMEDKKAQELKEKFKQQTIDATRDSKSSKSLKTTKWHMEDHFNCSPDDIFDALTNPGKVSAYTQGPADVSGEPGKAFSIMDGKITGENATMEKGKKIVQKWRFKDWPANHHSKVEIDIANNDGRTEITLNHSEIPDQDNQPSRVEQEWRTVFFARIKQMFGYGSAI